MTTAGKESLSSLLERVAAETAVPGGGSVSAVAAAFSAALGAMAGRFTVGREKFKEAEAEVSGAVRQLDSERVALLGLAEEDSAAYAQVDAALKLPRETPEEKAERAVALELALVSAARPPLEVARRSLAVADSLRRLRGIANPNLISDVGVGMLLSGAAARGALLNVFVNLKSIRSGETRAPIEFEAKALWRRLRDVDADAAGIAAALAGGGLD